MSASSFDFVVLQNGQSCIPRFWAAQSQPLHILLVQHALNTENSPIGKGMGKVQIGQKSPSGLTCP